MSTSRGGSFVGGLLVGGVAVGTVALLARNAKKPKGVLEQITEHVLRDQQDPDVRRLAFGIVGNLDHRQVLARLERIFDWCVHNLQWKPDPASRDKAAPLAETIELGGGDCDCLCTAFSTLAEAAGHKAWLLHVPNHVLTLVEVDVSDLPRLREVGFNLVTAKDASGREHHFAPYDVTFQQPGRSGELTPRTFEALKRGQARIIPVSA